MAPVAASFPVAEMSAASERDRRRGMTKPPTLKLTPRNSYNPPPWRRRLRRPRISTTNSNPSSTFSKRQLSFLALFVFTSTYSAAAYKDDSYYGNGGGSSGSNNNYYGAGGGQRGRGRGYSGSRGSGPDSMASSNATAQRIFFDDQGFKIVYELTNSFLYVLTVTDDADSGFNLTAMIEAVSSMEPESFFRDYMAGHWQELALYKIGFLICVAVGET